MRTKWKNHTSLFLCVIFQSMVLGTPCEEVAFAEPHSFFKAMTEGLILREEQAELMTLYLNSQTPYPKATWNKAEKELFEVLNHHPELSKIALREQILEFSVTERNSPVSFRSLISGLMKSAGKIRNSLFNIEENLGFYMTMLEQQDDQKADFIAYLNTTALNLETRQFVKDTSKPYRERTVVLYKALEEIRNSLFSDRASQLQDKEIPATSTMTQQRIGQAMANLVHVVGFGNKSYIPLLKSTDWTQSYQALRNILDERDRLAFLLGFEGHFADLKNSLGAKIEDINLRLQPIEQDMQNQPSTIKEKKVLRLRVLSLQESPFRSCMGGDCATQKYFTKALDPNFLYFTLTDREHQSSGQVTVVLGEAKNKSGQKIKTAFVDKIQNVHLYRLKAMLEGIRLSLREKGYTLALPTEVGDHNDLSNKPSISQYVHSQILPNLNTPLTDFKPHSHPFSFSDSAYSRADKSLPLLVFESGELKEVSIKASEVKLPQVVSPSLNIRSLYAPILALEKATKEEDQLKFLSHLLLMYKTKSLNISKEYVELYLDFVLNRPESSFKVRKKAFYTLIEFKLFIDVLVTNVVYDILIKKSSGFSAPEKQTIIGEMSNWKNTTDYRRNFISDLTFYQKLQYHHNRDYYHHNPGYFNWLLNSLWSRILDKTYLLNHYAEEGDIAIVQNLLKAGANVNGKDRQGKTALIRASIAGHKNMVQFLLKAEADGTLADHQGTTASEHALKRGHTDIGILLLTQQATTLKKDHSDITLRTISF